VRKILTVVGARPQFIKASAVSRALMSAGGLEECLVHTGQHADADMSSVFFQELELPAPVDHLGISGGGHGQMTGRMLERIEAVMERERPAGVLVYGDTNSTLAGALAAAKLGIPVVHVEAGLRSFKMSMPEEINRVMADRISSVLCCPTRTAVDNLSREGFPNPLAGGALFAGTSGEWRRTPVPWVANVGDVMLDVLRHYRAKAEATSRVLERLGLAAGQYAVLTAHRASNTRDADALGAILRPVVALAHHLPVVFPVHPRTAALLRAVPEMQDSAAAGIIVIGPLSYLDFLQLQARARAILTDSGGVQKEAFFLGVPCVTLRNETEWPETLADGWNRLLGDARDPVDLFQWLQSMPVSRANDPAAFGDGNAAQRVVDLLEAAAV
jgi:UDP-GlcNAc3NAcA epimerase